MDWTTCTVTPVYIQCLYNSISRRIRSVIVAKGHITKYWKWQVCKINLFFPIAYIPQVMRWQPSWWNNYGHLLYFIQIKSSSKMAENVQGYDKKSSYFLGTLQGIVCKHLLVWRLLLSIYFHFLKYRLEK
jgi:hypothetical protein